MQNPDRRISDLFAASTSMDCGCLRLVARVCDQQIGRSGLGRKYNTVQQ